jgi:serine/threonine protein kinase
MRDLIRQVLKGYKSLELEGQDEGYVQFSGQEPETRQDVSIKILPRVLGSDPQMAARFDSLARNIRTLNHPNIASIRKVGEEAGLPYIVSRAIEKAEPLAAKLDQSWAVNTAADLIQQIGQAVEHAYNKGVVHGALVPENIVVQDDGRVLVTDFGVNQLMELVGAEAKRTASPYLAPERVAGQAADARADVYSLAAILYSMLAKRAPQVIKGQVAPPSRFNPDVPPAMDEVIVKALASNPADRYPDTKTFLAALAATTLVPAGEKAPTVTAGVRCPRCGAKDQKGRFCRKCGFRLERLKPPAAPPPSAERSILDEPIQITKIEVGHVDVGKGVEVS